MDWKKTKKTRLLFKWLRRSLKRKRKTKCGMNIFAAASADWCLLRLRPASVPMTQSTNHLACVAMVMAVAVNMISEKIDDIKRRSDEAK